jgi:hypothetical protein
MVRSNGRDSGGIHVHMKMRNKFLALLGATVLSVGVVGVAFANTLSEDHPGQVNVSLDELISGEAGVDEDCTDFADLDMLPGEGEVGLHFILTTPEAESGNISGSVDGDPFGPVPNTVHSNGNGNGGGSLHFYVVVDGDGDSVVDEATTDVDGGQLTLSHICFGEAAPTPTPTFSGGEGGLTECPCDTIPGANTSGPADGAWLLVVALGVLLASIVVLTPARAKSRR